MKKTLLYYFVTLAIAIAGIAIVVSEGDKLPVKQGIGQTVKPVAVNVTGTTSAVPGSLPQAFELFLENVKHPLSLLLLQIIVILIMSRLFGVLLTKLGQQMVVGEIIAGIVLGPSVVGALFPGFFQFIFPADSLKNLQFLSQIGLAFFMFIIGLELDVDMIKKKAKDAIFVSHASIVFPFLLGAGAAYFLYESFAPDNVGFLSFSLFIGIAVSITAFPVLARILQERGMTRTPVGALALTCAATGDVTAWCILAAVIAIAKAGALTSALFTIFLAILFVTIMLLVVKPLLHRFTKEHANRESSKLMITISFLVLLSSAYITESIGIHALFGSFIAGVVMPNNELFKKRISGKIEDVSVMLLLPIFFAFAGLRTQIGLLNNPVAWSAFGLVLATAVIGKFGGSTLSAKLAGQSWKDSWSLGALMNTRGLMELIVLNIGYDLGILAPEIFSMMVLMALVTTFMTGPTLNFINWVSKKRAAVREATRITDSSNY